MSADAAFEGYETLPYVAVNPTDPQNVTASWTQDYLRASLVAASLGGGASFSKRAVPGISDCTGNPSYQTVAHPEVSFGPDGRGYVVSSAGRDAAPAVSGTVCSVIPCGTLPDSAIFVNTSADGGRTWSGPPALVYLEARFPAVMVQDAHVTADPERPGTAYASWTEIDALINTPVRIAQTTDGGRSWGLPQTLPVVAAAGRVVQPMPVRVLGDGSLLVVYVESDFPQESPLPTTVWAVRSPDRGMTWSLPTKIADIPDNTVTDPHDRAFTVWPNFQMPSVAVAPDARTIYVAWHSPPAAPAGLAQSTSPSHILFSKSTDAGGTWSAPAAVHATSGQRFLPTIAVSPEGTIGVSYYDFDSDVAEDGALSTDLWFTHSHDGGASWRRDRLSGPFDLRDAPAGFVRVWYAALAGVPGGLVSAFAQPNPPTATTGATDIRYARVRVKP